MVRGGDCNIWLGWTPGVEFCATNKWTDGYTDAQTELKVHQRWIRLQAAGCVMQFSAMEKLFWREERLVRNSLQHSETAMMTRKIAP